MSAVEQENPSSQLPEDLPPVQPPSAGFIIQLFVVPGLIVLAIVAVYLLFGRLATGEQDWRSQVVELRHPNEHRRWRGATGLAQILKADQESGSSGQNYAENKEFAQALVDLLADEIRRSPQTESDLKIQAYLARALGLFDLPDLAVPALIQAMQPGIDREVRKNALLAIASMSDRLAKKEVPLSSTGLSDELLKASKDEDPLIRQLASYTLGLFSAEWSTTRLEVMLADSDFCTRANAAMALARQHDVRGFAVFKEILQRGTPAGNSGSAGTDADAETIVALKNCLSPAIESCADKLSEAERTELVALVQPIAEKHSLPGMRVEAQKALQALRRPQ
ncbi:MAG: HEAT repeat domain-containing protein [Planctomycetes bacterium]|nr:HEAT repeat domain-containing protein [Planctomycetota bacterium]